MIQVFTIKKNLRLLNFRSGNVEQNSWPISVWGLFWQSAFQLLERTPTGSSLPKRLQAGCTRWVRANVGC